MAAVVLGGTPSWLTAFAGGTGLKYKNTNSRAMTAADIIQVFFMDTLMITFLKADCFEL
jgi:hypothetical protein